MSTHHRFWFNYPSNDVSDANGSRSTSERIMRQRAERAAMDYHEPIVRLVCGFRDGPKVIATYDGDKWHELPDNPADKTEPDDTEQRVYATLGRTFYALVRASLIDAGVAKIAAIKAVKAAPLADMQATKALATEMCRGIVPGVDDDVEVVRDDEDGIAHCRGYGRFR